MALYKVNGVDGQLEVFEDKVIITREGILGFLSQGLAGAKTIPMSAIQSVQFKEGTSWTNGFIQFSVLGGKEAQGGLMNAANDENTVMLRKGEQTQKGREIKEYIENRIIKLSKQQVAAQEVSAADEIKKFKELLDMGIISQEEFGAKKKQLLGL